MSSATLTLVRPTVDTRARHAGRAARPGVRPVARPVAMRVARQGARQGARPAGALVLTARGRRCTRALVLASVTGLLALALVLAWVTLAASIAPGASAGDGRPGVASGAGTAQVQRTVLVVVAPGDTLWQLAREHAPDRDPRSVVADVVALNDLGSTGVQAGTELLVPVD